MQLQSVSTVWQRVGILACVQCKLSSAVEGCGADIPCGTFCVWLLTVRWFDSLHHQPRQGFCRLSLECSAKKITPLNTPVPRHEGFLMLKGTETHQDCHKGGKLDQEPCNPKPLEPPERNLGWVGYFFIYLFIFC